VIDSNKCCLGTVFEQKIKDFGSILE